MQSIQLTLFEIEPPRKSLIQYLTRVSWDNYLELVLRSACSLISGVAVIAITAMPCKAPEEREIIERECVIRRRQRKFGTLIVANNHKTMYIGWHKVNERLVYRDTITVNN